MGWLVFTKIQPHLVKHNGKGIKGQIVHRPLVNNCERWGGEVMGRGIVEIWRKNRTVRDWTFRRTDRQTDRQSDLGACYTPKEREERCMWPTNSRILFMRVMEHYVQQGVKAKCSDDLIYNLWLPKFNLLH